MSTDEKGPWFLCPRCWSVFGPDTNEACDCEQCGDVVEAPRVEVVPAALLTSEQQRREAAETRLREVEEALEEIDRHAARRSGETLQRRTAFRESAELIRTALATEGDDG